MDLQDKISLAFEKKGVANKVVPAIDGLRFCNLQDEEIFFCTVTTDQPTSDIERFKIADDFQGAGLSTIALQTLAKHFDDSGAFFIGINLIRDDGITFWPRFGAEPSSGFPIPRCYATPVIEDYFVEKLGDYLMDAFIIAEDSPQEAWYHLTDPKTGAPKELIARLNNQSALSSMYMDLTHPTVRERLGLDQS